VGHVLVDLRSTIAVLEAVEYISVLISKVVTVLVDEMTRGVTLLVDVELVLSVLVFVRLTVIILVS
jgi:hypothetical protein